ncbi:MAG: DVU0298 family protein [Thermodesulfovibrionales bacterium]
MATGTEEKIGDLVDDAIRDHKNLKRIISLLYDADMRNRLLGAKAIGEIAKRSPEIIKKRWNRIFYAFDDTMSCWGAAEALGEIGRNIPDMRSRILLFLRKFEKDEISCQGFIWAITRIGQVDREKIKDFIPDIVRFLDSKDACMVGQAIWGLGELRVSEVVEKIRMFSEDERETWIYDNETARIAKVSEIAREAIEKSSRTLN